MAGFLSRLRAELDRFVHQDMPWARLERELVTSCASPEARRVAVRAELRRQAERYGPHVSVPDWAKPEVLAHSPTAKIVGAHQANHRASSTDYLHGRSPQRLTEADAMRALVIALAAAQDLGKPLSLAARDFAAGRPGLGERWADRALRRLESSGVLFKQRGRGRASERAWHVIELDEALRRVSGVGS